MIEWAKNAAGWWTSGWLGVLLYWLPLGGCLVGYALRSMKDVRSDLALREREGGRYYVPRITLGTLVGRLILSVVPVANLVACICDVGIGMLRDFVEWIGRVLDIPLVPQRKRRDQKAA